MQIILMEKVANLGQLGDVVKVKDGYARNFLIPTGKAKRATAANKAEFEGRRGELERAQEQILDAARVEAAKVEGTTVQISRKAGVDGRLFGSVTNSDISDALSAQGFSIERSMVRLPDGPLKHIGDHPIAIQLHGDVVVTVSVSVLGES